MKLTDQQIKAISHFEGPALVLAVPGAGKTTVLLNRIQNLIEKHQVKGSQIMSITFSKAQALDMEKRFEKFNLAYKEKPYFSTIHAFSYQIIRAYLKEAKKDLTLIESPGAYNKYSLIRRLYYQLNQSFIKDDSLEDFLSSYSYIKNMMISPESYLKANPSKIKSFLKLYYAYDQVKKEKKLFDFDDMLTLAKDILDKDEKILNRIRRQYQYIQVDEAQDTSKIQMEIIKTIASPKNNIFMVADDDQSIYGFRGANPKELLDFKTIYPQAELIFMEENHRSHKDIVLASNKFIQKNNKRYKKSIKATKEKLNPIRLITCRSIEAEYKFLIGEIKEKLEDEKTVAVLYRNNISSMALVEALEKEKVPFFLRDQKKTYLSHFVIEDVLDILKFALDASDFEIYKKIYYKLGAYLKKEYLSQIKTAYSSHNLLDALLEIPYLKDYQQDNIIQLKYSFDKIKKLPLERSIAYIEESLGYGDYLRDKILKSGTDLASPKIVLESLKYIAKGLKDVYELEAKLNWLKNYKNPASYSKLTLSTIHSSKGLEYDSVYLIDLVQGEFPSRKEIGIDPRGREDSLEEERRLFYVAMTRAKKDLALISLKTRNGEKVEPSIFFDEVRKLKE